MFLFEEKYEGKRQKFFRTAILKCRENVEFTLKDQIKTQYFKNSYQI